MPSFRSAVTHIAFTVLAIIHAASAHAQDTQDPRQLIEHLGVEIRQLLEDTKATRTAEDAEKAVAVQIAKRIAQSPGDPRLTQADERGRTPLMLAVSGGYPWVVTALLTEPTVKQQINAANAAGETAWMLAQFAPTMTLVACQPGTLTRERAQLLPPYLRRMALQMKDQFGRLVAITQALEGAGATGSEASLKQAWLARCPNTAADLREQLGSEPLMPLVISDAIARQMAFNKAFTENPSSLPGEPPADMKFLTDQDVGRPGKPLRLQLKLCSRMPKPDMRGMPNWSGKIVLKAKVFSRAGVVETADFEVIEGARDKAAVDYFRSVVLRSLAGYYCDGDTLFEQEFMLTAG